MVRHLRIVLCFFSATVLAAMPLCAGMTADSVRLNFEMLTTKDGLSQGMVRCIYQDKEGFLWFATKDGLNKYDGYRFTVFRHNPQDEFSLPENYVSQMLEDDNGNFWLGTTTKGLWIFDKVNERFYPAKFPADAHVPIRNEVRKLDMTGGLLSVQMLRDLYVFDIRSVRPEQYRRNHCITLKLALDYNARYLSGSPEALTGKGFNRTAMITDDELWVLYFDTLHICRHATDVRTWTMEQIALADMGLKTESVNIAIASQIMGTNSVFFQTNREIGCWNRSTRRFDFLADFVSTVDWVTTPIRDAQGNFRISTGEVFYLFNPYTYSLKLISNPEQFQLRSISTCIDREKIVWTGTSGFGALKYDARKANFKVYSKLRSIVLNATSSSNAQIIHSDAVIVTQAEPTVRQRFHQRYLMIGKAGKKDVDIKRDTSGKYWFNEYSPGSKRLCLYSLDPRTDKLTEYDILEAQLEVYKFLTSDDRLCVTALNSRGQYECIILDCSTGALLYRAVFPIKSNFVEYRFISHCIVDTRGKYWFATVKGLLCFDPKTQRWQTWQNSPGDTASLSENCTFSLCLDPRNPSKYLWVGTNGGGVCRLDFSTGKFIHYTEENGLPNNVIYGVLSDANGSLWLSSNKGICALTIPEAHIRDERPVPEIVLFTEETGLGDFEFNRYEFGTLSSGELVFGGITNITVFDPAIVLQKGKPSPLKFTDLRIFNHSVSFRSRPDILSCPITYARTITLAHNEAYFTIECALLEYSKPRQKRYKYYLEGIHDKWIENESNNTIAFSELQPGSYVLHVMGRNSSGVWSNEEITLTIIIIPPWWRTWWFYGGSGVLACVLGFSLYRYRLRQVLKIYELRNSIARDLHDEIGSTLSSISLSSAILLRLSSEMTDDTKALLIRIGEHAQTTMEAMSDIVWTINTKNDALGKVIERLFSFAAEILEPLGTRITLEAAEPLKTIRLDMSQRKNLYLFCKEAITNIAKHSQAQSAEIRFSNRGSRMLTVVITDNGKGFRYPDVSEDAPASRGGNGLGNLQQRANDLAGRLTISSSVGNGTSIVLEFEI